MRNAFCISVSLTSHQVCSIICLFWDDKIKMSQHGISSWFLFSGFMEFPHKQSSEFGIEVSESRLAAPLRPAPPSLYRCFNGKQACRLTVLERWAKALMWSSSSYMISRSSPVLWPGLQTSTGVSQRERATQEFLRASLLSSLLPNEKCHVLMRSESRLVGKQPSQMICWHDGTLCSKWWVRLIVCLRY